MIEKLVRTEFGDYTVKYNHGYKVNSDYICIDVYENVEDEGWLNCPCCGLKPKVWVFDNGRNTACSCANNKYDAFNVKAESIMSVLKRTGSTKEYDSNKLKNNWNNYCFTMINSCNHADLRLEGKW